MIQGIGGEKEITALIDLALDQSLPRDVRRMAGERLNDLRKTGLAWIGACDNLDVVARISRTGTMANCFIACAKGRLATLKGKPDKFQERILALLEEQNALLRRLAT